MGIIGTPQLIDASSSIDEQYIRTYERVFQVFGTFDASEAYIRNNLGIGIGATHPDDSGSLCKGISVKLADKNFVAYDSLANPAFAEFPPDNGTLVYKWEASVSWGVWDPNTHTATGDPVDQPTRVFPESQTFEEIVTKDTDGNPVCNSAYVPFDPTITRDRTRPILRIVRNERSFSLATILGYADKVNSDVVGGFAPKTLKCSAPTAEKKFGQANGAEYWEVTYILAYNPDTWKKKILDAGYERLDSTDPTKRHKILDDSGVPISVPAMLDGAGQALPAPIDDSMLVYQEYDIYESISFADSFGFDAFIFS